MSFARPVPSPVLRCEVTWSDGAGGNASEEREIADDAVARAAMASFAAATLLATPRGPAAVETLRPGDAVRVHGVAQPARLVWSGTALDPGGPAGKSFRVMAHAFGSGRPAADVVLGPGAHVLLETRRCIPLCGVARAFSPVAALEDGVRVVAIRPPAPVAAFGLACAGQVALSASGLPVAAWHPAAAHGHARIGDLARAIPPLARAAFGPASLAYLSASEARDLAG